MPSIWIDGWDGQIYLESRLLFNHSNSECESKWEMNKVCVCVCVFPHFDHFFNSWFLWKPINFLHCFLLFWFIKKRWFYWLQFLFVVIIGWWLLWLIKTHFNDCYTSDSCLLIDWLITTNTFAIWWPLYVLHVAYFCMNEWNNNQKHTSYWIILRQQRRTYTCTSSSSSSSIIQVFEIINYAIEVKKDDCNDSFRHVQAAIKI